MDIKEKAKAYAEGKALNAINMVIEEAYAAGYKEGYEDGLADIEMPDSPPKYKPLTYIDLELPSGTRWAVNYLTNTKDLIECLDFEKANIFNIPTLKQYQELLDHTEQLISSRDGKIGTEFVSNVNKARFYLPHGHYYISDNPIFKDNYLFWLRDHGPAVNKRLSVFGSVIKEVFKDFKLPVVLVSKCDIVTMFADANERNRHIRHRSRGLRAPCREAPPRCFS